MVLSGDATLRYTGFDDHVPIWETTGEIDVQPAGICETDQGEQTEESVETAESKA